MTDWNAPEPPGLDKRSILVVDDDPSVRATVCRHLALAGFEPLPVKTGQEALRVLDFEEVSLVVLDIFMPDKDGLETLADIRRTMPKLKVITMSGNPEYAGMDVLKWSEILGASRVLSKPFSRDELMEAVQSALRTD